MRIGAVYRSQSTGTDCNDCVDPRNAVTSAITPVGEGGVISYKRGSRVLLSSLYIVWLPRPHQDGPPGVWLSSVLRIDCICTIARALGDVP